MASFSSASLNNKMNKSLALAANNDNDNDNDSQRVLPDEILLKILNKVSDLKQVCKCKLISKHIHSLVLQVDTISITLTLVSARPYPCGPSYHTLSTKSMNRFTHLKSLSIHVPISSGYLDHVNVPFFKWKVNFHRVVKSFVFISPSSVYDKTNGMYLRGNGDEVERGESFVMKFLVARNCLEDFNMRFLMLFGSYVPYFPLLENILITDSVNGGVVSFCGVEEVSRLRNSLPSYQELLNMRVDGPHRRTRRCIVPLLDLPVSGCVMKNVTLYLFDTEGVPDDGDYSFITRRVDEGDKAEAAYSEAMVEILKNHRRQMEIMP